MTEPVVVVVRSSGDDGYRLAGSRPGVPGGNSFLAHLESRAFAAASVRAYAYDLANFARFLTERGVSLAAVVPTDLFDWVDWQCVRRPAAAATVVPIAAGRGSAPASVNRRGRRRPRVLRVPGAVRRPGRQSGADAASRVGATAEGTRPAWAPWPGPAPARWPTSSSAAAAAGVVGSGRGVGVPRRSGHAPGPAIVLLMVLGGLRAAEVRSLRLADVDQGRRRVRIVGKGGRERIVPVDGAFFAELAAYLRAERPAGLSTIECFVVLHGPTAGRALTEAGLRSVFRYHRQTSGARRVRPHRLRHTYGSELAAAGIDLLVLRDLMGHVSPETTAGYVHLSSEHLAAEYAAARAVIAMTAVVARCAIEGDHQL